MAASVGKLKVTKPSFQQENRPTSRVYPILRRLRAVSATKRTSRRDWTIWRHTITNGASNRWRFRLLDAARDSWIGRRFGPFWWSAWENWIYWLNSMCPTIRNIG